MTGRGQPPGKLISRLGGNRFFCPKKRFPTLFLFRFTVYVFLFSLAKFESLTAIVCQTGGIETFVAVLFQEKVIVRHEKLRVQIMHDLFTFMRNKFLFAQRNCNRRRIGQGAFVLYKFTNSTRLSARCHFTGTKKVSISRAQPTPTCPRNGYCPHQIITHRAV